MHIVNNRLFSYAYTLRSNSHFPGEPGLASCLLNSPSPFIPGLCILLEQPKIFHVILNTIPPGLFQLIQLKCNAKQHCAHFYLLLVDIAALKILLPPPRW